MAGRKLQQQRRSALDALTDQQAAEVALRALPTLRMTAVRNLLMSTGDYRTALTTLGGDQRAALAALIGTHPATARVAVSIAWHTPEVEQALGITRTTRQQRS